MDERSAHSRAEPTTGAFLPNEAKTDTAGPLVRRALPSDDHAVAPLLCMCSPVRFGVLGGDADHALNLVTEAIGHPGNETSRDVIRVVEIGGRIAGAISAFSADERHLRRRRLLLVALRHRALLVTPRHRALWQWPFLVRLSMASLRRARDLPPDTLYIDALATDERFRRQGVATILLDLVMAEAGRAGLSGTALRTHKANAAARALYEHAGFRVLETRPEESIVLLYRENEPT